MLVMMLGQTRIFLGMAKDGLLPKGLFAAIHPTFKTPWKSTIFVGAIVSIVAAVTPIDKVSQLTSSGTLFAFAMICGAVWLLRVREPNLERLTYARAAGNCHAGYPGQPVPDVESTR